MDPTGGDTALRKKTFAALAGTYGILFLLTTAWTAWQIATHGAANVSAPVFPAMALGALVGVVVIRIRGNRQGQATLATALAAIVSFAAVAAAGLWGWFIVAG
ncbi:hypothetical protein [Dietzia sp. B32]|uniref:hypothetical protein n=1 Tax=Dietzia sp. B32 TaxID=2915130 RepID=UPI0021AD7B00|nr:hypothetical protein [Dietzia sp. B32]UVE95966.1 hypothetical protein L8M95_04025 [Dietzia sp. B32]